MFENPTVDDLRKAAERLGTNSIKQYFNAMPEEKPPVKYPRDGFPTADEYA